MPTLLQRTIYIHCKYLHNKANCSKLFDKTIHIKEMVVCRISHNIQDTNYMNESKCTGILDEFADAASNFTKCSIKHARPVTLCAECINQYVAFHDIYQKLITNDTCKSSLISNDRLDAVLVYHDNILAVWVKGNCNGICKPIYFNVVEVSIISTPNVV